MQKILKKTRGNATPDSRLSLRLIAALTARSTAFHVNSTKRTPASPTQRKTRSKLPSLKH